MIRKNQADLAVLLEINEIWMQKLKQLNIAILRPTRYTEKERQ